MSRNLKIVLGVVVGSAILVIAIVGVGVSWISHRGKEVVGEFVNTSLEAVDKAAYEGKEFGVNTDQASCIREAFSRQRRINSLTGNIANEFFLESCLEVSQPTAGFCDGVPKRDERLKSLRWQLERCAEVGLKQDRCLKLFRIVQKYCEESRSQDSSSGGQTPTAKDTEKPR
jgi:hypothetical protein